MKQNNKGLLIGIGVVIVIAVVAIIAAGGHKATSTYTNTSKPAKSSSSSSNTSGAVATTDVKIQNYMFSPMVIKVKVGSTVTWTNEDQVHHTVTADTVSADAPNGPLIGQGEKYSFTFKKAGTYTFHCMPHPYMHGTVVVTN
jgi:amicyanin